jgi:regulator of protease activity HflC (stomatin/prohibitin superfamily)
MVVDLTSILGIFLKNFFKVLPVNGKIVHEYEEGVRWTFGRPSESKQGGHLYFFCPYFQSLEVYDMTETPLKLGEQTIQVDPDTSFTVEAGATWKYVDPVQFAMVLGNNDDNVAVGIQLRGALATELTAMYNTNNDVFSSDKGVGELERRIVDSAQQKFKKFGSEVVDVKISSLANTQPYTVLGLKGIVNKSVIEQE